jgi:hypothetical protein
VLSFLGNRNFELLSFQIACSPGAEAPQQEGDEKDDGPIIDAEVVDEKKD